MPLLNFAHSNLFNFSKYCFAGKEKFVGFLVVLALLAGCSSQSRPVIYKDWNDEIAFPEANSDFTKYIAQVNTYLEGHSLSFRSEPDRQLNMPFELPANRNVPYRGKFLLIHGLNDSAYVWRDMAQVIADRGFDVRAILLSGHGSHPANMLEVSHKEWLKAARQHFKYWNTDDTPIYLGGFSMGAVISSILALENPDIDGLFLASPAFHSRLNHLLRWAWAYRWYKPWIFNVMILEDNPSKYNSIPVNSGAQYFDITQHLKDKWGDRTLQIPVLMVSTMDDSVVNVDYNRVVFQEYFTAPNRQYLIYSNDSGIVPQSGEIIRPSNRLDLRIINQSHMSLINAPNNPLYGQTDALLVCNGNDYPTFSACMRSKSHWFGAQHTASPDGVAVARTTYNPDFSTIVDMFDDIFISK